MKRTVIVSLAILTAAIGTATTARAQIDLGPVTIDQDDLKVFYKAVGEYFGLADNDVDLLRNRGVSNDEMSTIFTIARAAGVPYEKVLEMRLAGRSYNDIYRHFNVSPEIFYTPMKDPPAGPPYGNAYGHYKNKDKTKWKEVELTDDEVINLTNLKFVSEQYGYSPEDVVRLRSGGNDFVQIQKKVHTKVKGPKDKTTGPTDKAKGKDATTGKGADKNSSGKADKNKGSSNSGQGTSRKTSSGGGKSSSGGGGKGGGKNKPKM